MTDLGLAFKTLPSEGEVFHLLLGERHLCFLPDRNLAVGGCRRARSLLRLMFGSRLQGAWTKDVS